MNFKHALLVSSILFTVKLYSKEDHLNQAKEHAHKAWHETKSASNKLGHAIKETALEAKDNAAKACDATKEKAQELEKTAAAHLKEGVQQVDNVAQAVKKKAVKIAHVVKDTAIAAKDKAVAVFVSAKTKLCNALDTNETKPNTTDIDNS